MTTIIMMILIYHFDNDDSIINDMPVICGPR